MKNKNIIQNELELQNCSNINAINKNEFKAIQKLIFENEIAQCLVIGLIDNEAWMMMLTDRRIIMAKKENEYGSKTKEFGLEQIQDINLDSFGEIGSLIFSIKNLDLFKMDYIDLKEAREFGRAAVKAIQNWNN